MSQYTQKNPADYIMPLYMNGLHGRMLRMSAPAESKKEIMLVYGHHASLERMFGIAEDLNQYGAVTIPDLPGFGGMQAFYRLGEKPTLDNLADYLAAFVKLRYNRRRITIMAMSFGFVIVTRMLQRHPELAKKVDVLVSIVGFVHTDDFHFKRRTIIWTRILARLLSMRLPSWILSTFVIRRPVIRFVYHRTADTNAKLRDADPVERERRINFEVGLWKCNDIRTYMYTTRVMFDVDLCTKQVNLPVYHVAVGDDRYFDNHVVEQHMRIIYNDFTLVQSKMEAHAPTVIATAKEAAPLIPKAIRSLLQDS